MHEVKTSLKTRIIGEGAVWRSVYTTNKKSATTGDPYRTPDRVLKRISAITRR